MPLELVEFEAARSCPNGPCGGIVVAGLAMVRKARRLAPRNELGAAGRRCSLTRNGIGQGQLSGEVARIPRP